MFTSLIIWFKALVNCPKCSNPASIYLFKTNNRKTKKRCEICSNLTIKIPRRRRHQVSIVNFEHKSNLFLFFLLLTLIKSMPAGKWLCKWFSSGIYCQLWTYFTHNFRIFLVDFEKANAEATFSCKLKKKYKHCLWAKI